jgi:DNA-binding CsgD family transcriptional regulator
VAAGRACAAWSAYHQSRIGDALGLAETHLASDHGARAVIAACRLQQGRFEDAERALSPLVGAVADTAVLLDIRAQLRLAQMRPADALADALESGRRASMVWGNGAPGVAWRSTAALARLALGEPESARTLAEEELELARQSGLMRVIVRDLRVLGLAAQGKRTIELLIEAASAGDAPPARLERIHALVDLGAALRRANQRKVSRDPLRAALELAQRGGASALAGRARDELAATGARPRRAMLSGIEALTPSERRVADLAVGGLTTRHIANALFVTPKTVEFHLRHVYRKMDIPSSRAELVRALSAATPDKVVPVREESTASSNELQLRSVGEGRELRDHRRRNRR